jgi:phage gp37-like protein
MNYTINQIEDAILEAIKGSNMAGYCRQIDTYGGPLEFDSIREFLAGISPPACLVFYSDGRWEEERTTTKEMIFNVIVATKNLRKASEARKGKGPGSIGAYEMLNDANKALKGKSLGLDMGPLRPISESIISPGPTVAIYAIQYKTYFHEDEELTL